MNFDCAVLFNRRIDEQSANALLSTLLTVQNKGYQHPFVAFASAGGVAKDGIWLSETIESLGMTITAQATSEVASAAVPVFLSFTQRFVSPGVYFVIHPTLMAGSAQMSAHALQSLANVARAQDRLIAQTLSKRTAIPNNVLEAATQQEVPISSADAVTWGIAHEIREFQLPAGKEIFQI